MTNVQLLQDLIDEINNDIKEQERQLTAIHGGMAITKQIRAKLVAKKKSFEEIAKEEEKANKRKRKR